MTEQLSEGTSAAADVASLLTPTDPNVLDLAAAREAAELEARKLAAAEKIRKLARQDFNEQIMQQPGGWSRWANNMGDGPVSYEGASEYRNAWYQAVEDQRVFEAEQAS